MPMRSRSSNRSRLREASSTTRVMILPTVSQCQATGGTGKLAQQRFMCELYPWSHPARRRDPRRESVDFTHVSEQGARADDLPISVCAVLLAEACNVGLELRRTSKRSSNRSCDGGMVGDSTPTKIRCGSLGPRSPSARPGIAFSTRQPPDTAVQLTVCTKFQF